MKNWNRIVFAFVLVFLFAVSGALAANTDSTPVEYFRYKENADGVTITGYVGKGYKEVVVPSRIQGKPVLSVGNEAFKNHAEITCVVLGDHVRRIGNNTFQGCSRLEMVVVPGYLTSYGKYAFEKCRSMRVIVGIPGSEAENMARANNLDFYSLDARKEGYGEINEWYETPSSNFAYKISHDGITITGYKGKGIKDVIIPEEIGGIPVLSVGNEVFTHNSEIEQVVIGRHVIRIGNNAFASCANLRYVFILGDVQSWGKYAFDKCRKLQAIVGFEGTSTPQIAYDFGVPYGVFNQ